MSWEGRLEAIKKQLGEVQRALAALNTNFLNDVKNTQAKPQTMPQVAKDSKGLVTQGALYQFSKYQLQIEHPGYNLVQQLKQLPLCSFLRVVDQLTNVIPLSL